MKLARAVLAAALVGSGLIGVNVADAARLPCKALTDRAGDAPIANTKDAVFPIHEPPAPPVNAPSGWPSQSVGSSTDALDIVSADIATDKRFVTAVVRVKKLAATAPTAAPTGMQWDLEFIVDGKSITFTAVTDPTGAPRYQGSYVDPIQGGVLFSGGFTGAFDLKKSEVRITAPVALISGQARIKPGAKLTKLQSSAGPIFTMPEPSKKVSKGGILFTLTFAAADTASSTRTYVVNSRNCVTPGK